MFDKVVERFLRLSPVTVLSRLAVQRALDPTWLDQVFHQHRDRTYQKDLLFSSVIEIASHVVLGLQPSLHAAYQQASLDVSFQALYGKVGRTEPSVLRAMVRGSYERLAPVVENWAVRARRLVPGHRVASSMATTCPPVRSVWRCYAASAERLCRANRWSSTIQTSTSWSTLCPGPMLTITSAP